jgi:hypothetical protein
VVEVENDRTARLRFGDGLLGRALTAGDVGAEAIDYLVTTDWIKGSACRRGATVDR